MALSGYYGPQIWHHPLSTYLPSVLLTTLATTNTASTLTTTLLTFLTTHSLTDIWIEFIMTTFLIAHLPECLTNVIRARRTANLPLLPIFLEWTPMAIYTLSIYFWLYAPTGYSTLMPENHLTLFCLTMSFVFGRMTTKIILAHLTRQPFPYWTTMLLPLIIGAFITRLPDLGLPAFWGQDVEGGKERELWFLWGYFVFAFVAYFRWAFIVVGRICEYLNINCLTITPRLVPRQNQKQSLQQQQDDGDKQSKNPKGKSKMVNGSPATNNNNVDAIEDTEEPSDSDLDVKSLRNRKIVTKT